MSEHLQVEKTNATASAPDDCSDPSKLIRLLSIEGNEAEIMRKVTAAATAIAGQSECEYWRNGHARSEIIRKEIKEEIMDWELYMRYKEEKINLENESQSAAAAAHNIRTFNAIHFRFNVPQQQQQQQQQKDGEISSFLLESNDRSCYREKNEDDARMEKAKGNEMYKVKNYHKATEHYSASLHLYPIIDVYNNRAMANMKLEKYSEALADLNQVLKAEPNNVKARYRRAQCKQHFRIYEQALKDINAILKFNPNNKAAKTLGEQIQQDRSKLIADKTYRVRENFAQKETFNVEASRLSAFAEDLDEYLLEVDRTGCAKNCICTFCSEEDRRNTNKSTALRIKERLRWKPLTFAILDEMKIFPLLPPPEHAANSEDDNDNDTLCNGIHAYSSRGTSKRKVLNFTPSPATSEFTKP